MLVRPCSHSIAHYVKIADQCRGIVIYLTSKGSRMNFQTSPHTDGVTPGMRHVPIEFQFGIAVAANLRMIYQPKEDYHGALGLSLGE